MNNAGKVCIKIRQLHQRTFTSFTVNLIFKRSTRIYKIIIKKTIRSDVCAFFCGSNDDHKNEQVTLTQVYMYYVILVVANNSVVLFQKN